MLSKKFWEQLQLWANNVLYILTKIYTVCEVFFSHGLNEQKLSSINMIQNLFLIGKCNINNAKVNDKHCFLLNIYPWLTSKMYLKLPDYSDNAEVVNNEIKISKVYSKQHTVKRNSRSLERNN